MHIKDNICFYIGMGSHLRAISLYASGRNSMWNDFVNGEKASVRVVIVKKMDSQKEARSLERDLILSIRPCCNKDILNNDFREPAKRALSLKNIKDIKDWDSKTGRKKIKKDRTERLLELSDKALRYKLTKDERYELISIKVSMKTLGRKGRPMSSHTKSKISEAKRKSITCKETGQRFISIRQAANFFETSSANISRHLRSGNKIKSGFSFISQ